MTRREKRLQKLQQNLNDEETLPYFMNLHYKIVLVPEEDGSWGAIVPDLLGCAGAGETIEEALASLNAVKEAWFESRLLRGAPIPEPGPNTYTVYTVS